MSSYALESQEEFDRLERQSTFSKYDYKRELSYFSVTIPSGGAVLDAGCGSGVVSRHLAQMHPQAKVIGCDFSALRLEQARQAASQIPNLSFQREDVCKLSFQEDSFDLIICRYVLQHLLPKQRQQCLKELFRCLKPGGKLVVIDFDGSFYNIYPQSKFLAKAIADLEAKSPVDLRVGRKLVQLLQDSKFSSVDWKIETIECKGQTLIDEKELIPPRFSNALPFLSRFFGGEKKAQRFINEYLKTLEDPGLVLFYNKFLVCGEKARSELKLVP